uniref:Arf-GAP domain-containing protein n=1 Tax=Strongyloides venezuelensis TaxID=75913 RepID=A0A0K0FBN1_STRVS
MAIFNNHTIFSSWRCADCDAEKPTWASINLAVLLCSDCASIHRDLGRHISQLASLQKSYWSPYRLDLLLYLFANGSNNVWEYFLTDPSRNDHNNHKHFIKPKPESAITPTKERFIKEKYIEKKYASRGVDENQNDLDMQLFACVRTCHVETAFRLLIHGANPNYVNYETGETPLHIAVKEGQLKQVELLCIYGANLHFNNNKEESAKSICQANGNTDLLTRLLEIEFEISDRISWFLCRKMPNHDRNSHFLIPDIVGSQLTDKQRMVIKKYVNQNNELFCSISQDIFDEIERRTNEKIWYGETKERHEKLGSVVNVISSFLPLNPLIPSFRNQRRQKLAKFDTNAFVYLLVCHLKETKRRFYCEDIETSLGRSIRQQLRRSQKSSEKNYSNNDYEDYASVPSPESLSRISERKLLKRQSPMQNRFGCDTTSNRDVEILQNVVKKQTETINNLSDVIISFSREMKVMQEKIDRVAEENATLQNDLSRLRAHVYMKDTQFASQTNAFNSKNNTSFSPTNGPSSNTSNISNPLPIFNTTYSVQKTIIAPQNSSNTFKGHISPDIDYVHNLEVNEKYISSQNVQSQMDNSYVNVLSEKRISTRNEKNRPMKDGLSKTKIVRFVDDLTSAIRSLQTELLKPSPFVYPHCEAVNVVVFNILNSVPKSLQRKTVIVLMQKLENSMYKLESICSNPNINVHEASLAAFALALAAKNLFLTCE